MQSISDIRKDFPFFQHHPELVYLDSAATSLKHRSVIEAEKTYLEVYSTNIARGLYPLAELTTEKFQEVRKKVARFIGATSEREIIFTAGTTDGLNHAATLLESRVDTGDNIVTTVMEHHSNFLPWKELAQRKGAELRSLPILADGTLDLASLPKLINNRTKIVAFSAVSNVLGTINPVRDIVRTVREISPETLIIIDAAQAIGHAPLSVSDWDADFVAFSGHKLFGPTGIGVLYGKQALLETLTPVRFGGGMVLDVCAPDTVYKDIPECFEAGTPNIGGVLALGSAIDFIESLGLDNIRTHEIALTTYALTRLRETFGDDITIIGPTDPALRGGLISFALAGIHPHDIAQVMGESGICVRAGEHCAAPLHHALALPATTRVSLSVYNDEHDIDALVTGLLAVQKKFAR